MYGSDANEELLDVGEMQIYHISYILILAREPCNSANLLAEGSPETVASPRKRGVEIDPKTDGNAAKKQKERGGNATKTL